MHFFNIILISAITAVVSATPIPDDGSASYVPSRILFPNYIIPIYQANPTFASGTQYTGKILLTDRSDETRTMLGFDMPINGRPTYCRMKMSLSLASLNNWFASGSGKLNVYSLSNNPQIDPAAVSWDRKPIRLPTTTIWSITQPIAGGDAIVTGPKVPCPEGTRWWFEIAADPASGATQITWFELTTPNNGITIEMID